MKPVTKRDMIEALAKADADAEARVPGVFIPFYVKRCVCGSGEMSFAHAADGHRTDGPCYSARSNPTIEERYTAEVSALLGLDLGFNVVTKGRMVALLKQMADEVRNEPRVEQLNGIPESEDALSIGTYLGQPRQPSKAGRYAKALVSYLLTHCDMPLTVAGEVQSKVVDLLSSLITNVRNAALTCPLGCGENITVKKHQCPDRLAGFSRTTYPKLTSNVKAGGSFTERILRDAAWVPDMHKAVLVANDVECVCGGGICHCGGANCPGEAHRVSCALCRQWRDAGAVHDCAATPAQTFESLAGMWSDVEVPSDLDVAHVEALTENSHLAVRKRCKSPACVSRKLDGRDSNCWGCGCTDLEVV